MPAALPTRHGSGGRGARDRILKAARVLFGDRGLNATGVAELAAQARVSKRTLYHHFPSKDDVILAYLQDLAHDTTRGPESVLSRSDLSPRARLLELFVPGDGARHPMRGDPFVNAAVEVAGPTHPVHAAVAEYKRRFTERLGDIAREAGARDAEGVGRRLALVYDGAAAQAVVYDSTEPASDAYAMAAGILRQAID